MNARKRMAWSSFWRRQSINRETRQTVNGKRVPWGTIALVLIVVVGVPGAFDIVVGRAHPVFLDDLRLFIAVWYSIASMMLLWEAACALRLPKMPEEPTPDEIPACTAIIAAYLPNEQDIILETVLHMLSEVAVPADKLQVILAYNTPEEMPVEDVLRQMASHDARLVVLNVAGSHSKAENVNAAIQVATGDVVAIFDADHMPEDQCFHKAWRWLRAGYDIVQGRCVIRNHNENWIARTIAIEFDSIYTVGHQGRSNLSHTAIFGGSNGYWRREALRAAGMNGKMLTEDIDSSVRTLLSGGKIVHDRSIRSFELAPTQAQHWFFQRKRWAQGWFEVSLLYQGAILRTRHLNGFQKLIWSYLLGWREIYPIFSMQFFPLIFAAWWLGHPLHWFRPGFYLTTSILNLTSSLILTAITACCASREGRRGLAAWYFVYGLCSLPYMTAKTVVTLVAQYAHLRRDRAWVTTPRAAAPKSETARASRDETPALAVASAGAQVQP